MVPECLVEDRLKAARRVARQAATEVGESGLGMVAVVADLRSGDGGAITSMAVSPELTENLGVALMRCALSRILSLLVVSLGREGATACAFTALVEAEKLTDSVREHE